MDVVISTKAKEAGVILTHLFKTTYTHETEPLLDRLRKLYPEVVFSWKNGLRVKVPRGVTLPRAIEYFARRIDVILEDGTTVPQKNVVPERVVGPSVWELLRKPKL